MTAYNINSEFGDMNTVLTWISAIGSVASIIGIVITFLQVRTVRRIAADTHREISKTDAVADISKCNALVKESMTLLMRDDFVTALSKMRDVKDMIIKLKIVAGQFDLGDYQEDFESDIKLRIKALHDNINTIDNNHATPKQLNKSVICRSMDELSSFIVELQARITNKITH